MLKYSLINNENIVSVKDMEIEKWTNLFKDYMSTMDKNLLIKKDYTHLDWVRYPIEISYPLSEELRKFLEKELYKIFKGEKVDISGEIFLISELYPVSIHNKVYKLIEFKCYLSIKELSRRIRVQVLVDRSIVQINELVLDTSNSEGEIFRIAPNPGDIVYQETGNTLFLQLPFKQK